MVRRPRAVAVRSPPCSPRFYFRALRAVFGAEVPHYFRDLHDRGTQSVAPIVQNARDLNSDDPKCVVHTLGCTGDWTGGWDNVEPVGADAFITADLQSGRMVEVIARGEPAMMVCHWTGIHWNGEEKGFAVFREVVRRLHERFRDAILWMKLSTLARYWAAKECTAITAEPNAIKFRAPWACADFTVQFKAPAAKELRFAAQPLARAASAAALRAGTWIAEKDHSLTACVNLPRGASELTW